MFHLNEMLEKIVELEKQNAALLEALKNIEMLGRDARSNKATFMGDKARQAIAQAEGDET